MNHFNFHKLSLTVWTGFQGTNYKVREKSDLCLPFSPWSLSSVFKFHLNNNPILSDLDVF